MAQGLDLKVKPADEHVPFLDHIRGIAILCVFLFHCVATTFWPTFGDAQLKWNGWLRDFHAPASLFAVFPATLGASGVAMFFVVSGFCIHLSHERSSRKTWDIFFIRRFFRIYPPYLAALLAFSFFYPLTRLHFSSELVHVHSETSASLALLVSHLLLIHNFHPASFSGINNAFWSVAVEVQLYFLYPVLSWLVSRVGWTRALWVTGFIEMGLRGSASLETILGMSPQDNSFPLSYPFTFWFSWAIGAALADAYVCGHALPFSRGSFGFWPVMMLLCYFFKPLAPFCFTLTALATARIVAYLLEHRDRAVSTSWGWRHFTNHLRFAGTISYSAYLIHMPLLFGVPVLAAILFPGHSFHQLTMFMLCVFAWGPILICSYLFYHVIELPSISWGKWMIKKKVVGTSLDKAANVSLS